MAVPAVELKIRPLPDSRFIQGYPGIPPSSTQPLSRIDGEVIVKVNQRGLRGKYLRVCLMQVSMVPKGDGLDTIHEAVVPGPIILWESGKRSKRLQENVSVFTFSLRIPEALPPTIWFSDQGAGIKYKICAKLYAKSKRKKFSGISTPRIFKAEELLAIEKHEMHSAWPIYSQYRLRTATDLGYKLVVTSNRSCYGPGDRVCIGATLSVEDPEDQGIILRGFELSLDESSEIRSSANSVAQTNTQNICRGKLQINRPVRFNAPQKVELACFMPTNRVTVSICSRYIKVEHIITVRALLENHPPLDVSLPVMVTKWPRNSSIKAIERIGIVPSLIRVPGGKPAKRSMVFSGSYAPSRKSSLAHGTSLESMLETIESGDNTSYHTSPSTSPRSSEERIATSNNEQECKSPAKSLPVRNLSTSSHATRRTRPSSKRATVTSILEESPRPEYQSIASPRNKVVSPVSVSRRSTNANLQSVTSSKATEQSTKPKIRLTFPVSRSAEELSSPINGTNVSYGTNTSSDPGHSDIISSLRHHLSEADSIVKGKKKESVINTPPPPDSAEVESPIYDHRASPIHSRSLPRVPQRPQSLRPAPADVPISPLNIPQRSASFRSTPLPSTPKFKFLEEDPSRSPAPPPLSYHPDNAHGTKEIRPLPKRDTCASLATLVSVHSTTSCNTLVANPEPLELKSLAGPSRSPTRRPLPTPPATPPPGAESRPLSADEEKAMIRKQATLSSHHQRSASGSVLPPSMRPMTPRDGDANRWDADAVTLTGSEVDSNLLPR